MNQLSNDLILDICAAAEAFEGNPGVGALVLTGSGEEAFAGERLLDIVLFVCLFALSQGVAVVVVALFFER